MSSDAMRVSDASPRYPVEADAQKVPPGYKWTAAGLIPEDWRAMDLSCLCTLQRGFDLTEATSKPGTVPVYSSSGLSYFHEKAMVNPPGVVTGRKGLLGKVFVINEPFWPHDTTLWVKDFRGNAPQYVALVLQHFRLERLDAATSVPTLNRNNLIGHFVPVPSITAEQRAIAEALSDVDGLLGALEALIAKKRAIKQAAMQQLLNGKTRLPGFSGEWETKRLGDHVKFLRHGIHSRAELTAEGPVKYVHYGDVHTSTDVYLDPHDMPMPALSADRAKSLDRLKNGDLVLVDASEDVEGVGKSVEVKGLRDYQAVSGLHTIAARFDAAVLANGFKAYLQFCPTFRDHLRRLAAGTKVYATNRAHIASAEILLPAPDEQAAIAAVLSDMDADIAALEARCDKTRAIKQGMMQQLLTGYVRLVKPRLAKEATC